MKKRYQIDRQDAVRRFRQQAQESEQELQLDLPLKEVAAALQEGVGHLMRQAGLELMQLIMDNEVRQTTGERYQRRAPEQPFCWGREKGFLVVDGQKVPIEHPRLSSEDGREQRLGSYELFRRSEPLVSTEFRTSSSRPENEVFCHGLLTSLAGRGTFYFPQ